MIWGFFNLQRPTTLRYNPTGSRSFMQLKTARILLITIAVLAMLVPGFGFLKYFTISAKKLPHPNPTSYVVHVSQDELQRTLWKFHCYACGNYSGSRCLNDEGLTMDSPTKLVMSPPYWQKSDTYFSFGAPLDYNADYGVQITPLSDSMTEVAVHTSNAEVRIGPAFGLSHSGDLRRRVSPTTVEEYKFLLTVGCEVGETGMPELQRPR